MLHLANLSHARPGDVAPASGQSAAPLIKRGGRGLYASRPGRWQPQLCMPPSLLHVVLRTFTPT